MIMLTQPMTMISPVTGLAADDCMFMLSELSAGVPVDSVQVPLARAASLLRSNMISNMHQVCSLLGLHILYIMRFATVILISIYRW